jgi:hypothetical protein
MSYRTIDNELIFNVSENKENYSQRNNQYKYVSPKNPKLVVDANSECNVTSMVMALDYAGFRFPSGDFKQPENNLCKFIFESPEVLEYYKKIMPELYKQFIDGNENATSPNMVHAVLAYATNLWLGASKAVEFKTNLTIKEIFSEIAINQKPVVMSGTFPYTYLNGRIGTIGHINVLVGLVYNLKTMKGTSKLEEEVLNYTPTKVIIDDPYGDYANNFAPTSNRNNIIMPYSDFIKYYKPLNDPRIKWGHIIGTAGAFI